MTPCTRCGSYAINPHCHGRNDSDLDLCDVCYWRKRAEALTAQPAQAVDLEQFRDCVIEAKEVWLQDAENWKGRSRESQYREWVDDCDRLLALIDKQAGKAGNATAAA